MDFITSATTQAAITDIVQVVVGLGVAAAVYYFQKWTGIQIQQTYVDKLKGAAATEAGALVAQAEDNLKSKVVTATSPEVSVAAANIAARNPDVVKASGVSQNTLKQFVVGEVGKLQAKKDQ
jgi:hypothetical protein